MEENEEQPRRPEEGENAELTALREALSAAEERCGVLYRAAAERTVRDGLLAAGADERAIPLLLRLTDPESLRRENGLPVFGEAEARAVAAEWPFLFPRAEPLATAGVSPPGVTRQYSAEALRGLSCEDINRCWSEVSASLRGLSPAR